MAAEITPRVAAVRIGRGTGSAVVVPGDGVLVTNAHVTVDARRGRADFLDDLPSPVRLGDADALAAWSASTPRSRAPGSASRSR